MFFKGTSSQPTGLRRKTLPGPPDLAAQFFTQENCLGQVEGWFVFFLSSFFSFFFLLTNTSD